VPSQQYPVIRSARSNFDLFLSGLPGLVANASDLTERAMRVFSEENLAAVSSTLGNVQQASARLPATMREIEALTGDLRQTSSEIRAAAAGVRSFTDASGPQLNATVERIYSVADNLAKATERLDLIIADNRENLQSFTANGLPEFEALVREGRAAAQEFRELSRSLRDNPSRVLYQPPPGGMEIPR
jgi:phospholipid/cholesterol/gamma-HCH transport system substrate-binding protein